MDIITSYGAENLCQWFALLHHRADADPFISCQWLARCVWSWWEMVVNVTNICSRTTLQSNVNDSCNDFLRRIGSHCSQLIETWFESNYLQHRLWFLICQTLNLPTKTTAQWEGSRDWLDSIHTCILWPEWDEQARQILYTLHLGKKMNRSGRLCTAYIRKAMRCMNNLVIMRKISASKACPMKCRSHVVWITLSWNWDKPFYWLLLHNLVEKTCQWCHL